MAHEEKPGTGAIFKNEKRSEKAPDYRGSFITPSGEKLEIALWLTEARSGKKYFKVSVQEEFRKQAAEGPAPENEDDLPF